MKILQNFSTKYSKYTYLVISIFCIGVISTHVYAADSGISECSGNDAAICKTNPSLISGILGTVISILLFIAGTIAVIMIIVGGLRYITSDGDAGKASQAKNTIIYAIVGLVVSIMSYGIVAFVVGRL